MSALPYIAGMIFQFVGGFLADFLQNNKLSKQTTKRILTVFGRCSFLSEHYLQDKFILSKGNELFLTHFKMPTDIVHEWIHAAYSFQLQSSSLFAVKILIIITQKILSAYCCCDQHTVLWIVKITYMNIFLNSLFFKFRFYPTAILLVLTSFTDCDEVYLSVTYMVIATGKSVYMKKMLLINIVLLKMGEVRNPLRRTQGSIHKNGKFQGVQL